MLIDKDSLIVWGYKLAPYLVEIEFGWGKAWGSDTGRNLKASFSGTYFGYVPKIKLTFGNLTQHQIELISPILNSATQPVKYYNPDLKRIHEITTYTGDWTTMQKTTFSQVARAGKSFTVSLIGRDPIKPVAVTPGEFI